MRSPLVSLTGPLEHIGVTSSSSTAPLSPPPHPTKLHPTIFSCLRQSPSVLLLLQPWLISLSFSFRPPSFDPLDPRSVLWYRDAEPPPSQPYDSTSLGTRSLGATFFEEWGTKLFLCCWQKLRHFPGRPGLKWQVKLRSRKSVCCCNTRGDPAEVIELVRRLMAPGAV